MRLLFLMLTYAYSSSEIPMPSGHVPNAKLVEHVPDGSVAALVSPQYVAMFPTLRSPVGVGVWHDAKCARKHKSKKLLKSIALFFNFFLKKCLSKVT